MAVNEYTHLRQHLFLLLSFSRYCNLLNGRAIFIQAGCSETQTDSSAYRNCRRRPAIVHIIVTYVCLCYALPFSHG